MPFRPLESKGYTADRYVSTRSQSADNRHRSHADYDLDDRPEPVCHGDARGASWSARHDATPRSNLGAHNRRRHPRPQRNTTGPMKAPRPIRVPVETIGRKTTLIGTSPYSIKAGPSSWLSSSRVAALGRTPVP